MPGCEVTGQVRTTARFTSQKAVGIDCKVGTEQIISYSLFGISRLAIVFMHTVIWVHVVWIKGESLIFFYVSRSNFAAFEVPMCSVSIDACYLPSPLSIFNMQV